MSVIAATAVLALGAVPTRAERIKVGEERARLRYLLACPVAAPSALVLVTESLEA
jgi:hypothetical protein